MAIDYIYTPPSDGGAVLDFSSSEAGYTPPSNPKLQFVKYVFDFTKGYTPPPAGTPLTLVFGEAAESYTIAIENLTLAILLPDVTVVPAPNAIVIENITLPILLPNATVYPIVYLEGEDVTLPLLIENFVISGGQTENLPSGISTGSKIFSWGIGEKVEVHHIAPFKQSTWVPIHTKIPWGGIKWIDNHFNFPWVSIIPYKDKWNDFKWNDFVVFSDKPYQIPWISKMLFQDKWEDIKWKDFLNFPRVDFNSVWQAPPVKDKHYDIRWDWRFPGFTDKRQIISWGDGVPRDTRHQTNWGPKWYTLLCEQKYFPPKYPKLIFKPGEPGVEFGDPNYDPLNFAEVYNQACPYDHWHSGIRDKYEIEIVSKLTPPTLGVYYMQNSVSIIRLSDSVPIDWYSLSMQIDRDSWTWGYTITVPTSTYRDMVAPSGSTFTTIKITINGHSWTCMIEGWRESKSFGNDTWEIYGRSPSVSSLAAPYTLAESFTNNTSKQGATLIDDILQYSGYTFEWTPTDWLNPVTQWLIPAGVFSYMDMTKIEAVKSIVESVGSYVQTNADTDNESKLIILPHYPIQPWNWSTATEDHNLVDAQFYDIGRNFISYPIVNAVIVSGMNSGAVCTVTKNGTAGDRSANTITNNLITTSQSGAERGRIVLGKSGNWKEHSIRMFSLYPPGQEPSLITPGKIINVSEDGAYWKGHVTSCQITAAVASKGVVEVAQTLEVEQFIG